MSFSGYDTELSEVQGPYDRTELEYGLQLGSNTDDDSSHEVGSDTDGGEAEDDVASDDKDDVYGAKSKPETAAPVAVVKNKAIKSVHNNAVLFPSLNKDKGDKQKQAKKTMLEFLDSLATDDSDEDPGGSSLCKRMGTKGNPTKSRRIRDTLAREVYHILGDMGRPATYYGKEKMLEAALIAYRWCRENGYKYTLYLCADIIKDICTSKRRYRNRVNNKRYPKGSLRPGRPKKEKTGHAPKSTHVPQVAETPVEPNSNPKKVKSANLKKLQTPGSGDKLRNPYQLDASQSSATPVLGGWQPPTGMVTSAPAKRALPGPKSRRAKKMKTNVDATPHGAPSHPSPIPSAASTRIRVPRFVVKWSPTEELICCEFRWNFQDFVETLEDVTGQVFDTGMGYQYKIGNGREVFLRDKGEYRTLIKRIQKAPKGTRVFVRPAGSKDPYSDSELECDGDPGYATRVVSTGVLALHGQLEGAKGQASGANEAQYKLETPPHTVPRAQTPQKKNGRPGKTGVEDRAHKKAAL